MQKAIDWIVENKTYILSACVGLVTALLAANVISQTTANILYGLLGAAVPAALRHSVQKDTDKTEAVQEKVDKIGVAMGVLPPPEPPAPILPQLRTPTRVILALLLLGSQAQAATYTSPNFVVTAPTEQFAQQCAEVAEMARRDQALAWLGQEMVWKVRCPIRVKVTNSNGGGATSFGFEGGHIFGQHSNVEGRPDRLLASVLPHEVTHTVLAYYFRQAIPRWADEGGAVLSEDDQEKARHDQLCRAYLNAGRQIPLAQLFTMMDYPRDVMAMYAEGFSVSQFLVNGRGKPAFLRFVADGMSGQWDAACQKHYGYANVAALEQDWDRAMRATKGQAWPQVRVSLLPTFAIQAREVAQAPTQADIDAAIAFRLQRIQNDWAEAKVLAAYRSAPVQPVQPAPYQQPVKT